MESSKENCHLRELIRERLNVDEENVMRDDSNKRVRVSLLSFQETLPTERPLPPSTDHPVPQLLRDSTMDTTSLEWNARV